MTIADKRQRKRKIKRLEVEYTVDERRCIGFSSNFSLAGLFIHSNHPFPPDTPIEITIHLPNGTSKVRGRVARSVCFPGRKVVGVPVPKNGIGVEVLEKDEAYDRFVESLPE
ncbi:MAG: hypothetical protein OHK006_05170 [Thermodesulfovibrionales bacterium]